MRNLINFFLRYSSWILLIFYTVVSCVLLFQRNPYQHHLFLTSANVVSAAVYGSVSDLTQYFHLREVNDDLQRRNLELELEVLGLKQRLRNYHDVEVETSAPVDSSLMRYDFIIAHVIYNTVNRTHNYITIDRGSSDGIRPEMGVIDRNGVVGIVNIVGSHSARVISLLNSHLRLSCKVKGHDHVGSLVWDGKDPEEAILEELPRHAVFQPGDTIVTSGYSTVFPEGVPVGKVIEGLRDHDENFYSLRVKLFTDFTTLGSVKVVSDAMRDELDFVERDIDLSPKIP